MPSTVVIPTTTQPTRRVLINKVHSVVSNRIKDEDEQYLVRWKTERDTKHPPLSWHSISELARCLEHVQDYLEAKEKERLASTTPALVDLTRKRKSPDSVTEIERRSSPLDHRLQQASRTPSASRSPSAASTTVPERSSPDIYNGVLDYEENFVFARKTSGPDIARINIHGIPTLEMLHTARRTKTDKAAILIRHEYLRRLRKVPGRPINLVNTVDSTTPSLHFRYITEYVLGEGVYKADQASQVGCTSCSPNMGRSIGCEYTKKCQCLEYAAVDESRLNDEQKQELEAVRAADLSTNGFPKKFPYFTEDASAQRAGCLVPFYLHSRRPIYECNDNCNCGPRCRNKNVQFGRVIELEIFRTSGGRGWGLRCKEKLHEGQFIDTYRGEIITDAEATRREEASSKAKASYLYSLDKFAESEGLQEEDIYVVDGEFMGGPSKFMNHSCEPNCRQYTVSYNKHDCRVYDLAFFACRDIPVGEELTFDYLDKEEEDDEQPEDLEEGVIPCLCGAEKCRKWLWT